jgi:hypothetical protein
MARDDVVGFTDVCIRTLEERISMRIGMRNVEDIRHDYCSVYIFKRTLAAFITHSR